MFDFMARPNSYRPSLLLHCEVCGKEFHAYQSLIDEGKERYCGKECSFEVTNKKLEENGRLTRWKKGQVAHNFKNGICYQQSRNGGKKYRTILSKNHPFANKRGYVREHRLVVERARNITLNPWMDVHHINGDTLDNRLNNLEVISHAAHTREHNPVLLRWGKEG